MCANNMQTCDMHARNLPFGVVLIAVHSKTANRLCTHHRMTKDGVHSVAVKLVNDASDYFPLTYRIIFDLHAV